MAMIRRPLVHQFAVARRPGQQDPAGATAERFAHCDEFGTPALKRAEVACKRIAERRARLALLAKSVKEHLMQDHRVHCDQLLALEAVERKAGGFGIVELGELLFDEI